MPAAVAVLLVQGWGRGLRRDRSRSFGAGHAATSQAGAPPQPEVTQGPSLSAVSSLVLCHSEVQELSEFLKPVLVSAGFCWFFFLFCFVLFLISPLGREVGVSQAPQAGLCHINSVISQKQ